VGLLRRETLLRRNKRKVCATITNTIYAAPRLALSRGLWEICEV
jgi:hypothetical protein